MKRPFFLLTIVITLALPLGGDVQEATAEVARAIRNLSGQEAGFTQRFLPRGYKKEHVETGQVEFGDAPASRWSYETPEEKTFVFDGTTSWMYVPADQTVMVHEVSQEEKNRLPFFVLSDPEELGERFSVEQSRGKVRLTALDDAELLRSITLDFDASGRIQSLEYIDGQGNRTTFELGDWRKSPSPTQTFTFTPPPGVDVIEN